MIFLFGLLSYKYDIFQKLKDYIFEDGKKVREVVGFFLMLLIVLMSVLSYRKVELKLFWEFDYAIVPFIFIIFCVGYIFRIPLLSTILQFLGKHSLFIWLVHTFIRDWLGNLVWSVRIFWLVPLAILAVSLIISVCLNFLKQISGYDALIQKILIRMK